jgi:hypothetical protein
MASPASRSGIRRCLTVRMDAGRMARWRVVVWLRRSPARSSELANQIFQQLKRERVIWGPKLPSRDAVFRCCHLRAPPPPPHPHHLPGQNPSGNPTPRPGRSQFKDTLAFPPPTMSSEPKSLQQTFADSHQDRSPSAGPSKRWPKPVTPRGEKARPGEGRNRNPSGKWKPVRGSLKAATEAKALQEVEVLRDSDRSQSLLGGESPSG